MKFFFVSPLGLGLGLWQKIKDEGHSVTVHIGCKKGGPNLMLRHVGDGLVDKVDSWTRFKAEIRAYAAAGEHGVVVVFESDELYEYAEEIRALHVPLLGSGAFCGRLEQDREFGVNIAQRNGMDVPRYQKFNSITETIQHVVHKGMTIEGKKVKRIFFKTDAYIGADGTMSADNAEDLVRKLRHIRAKCPDKRINILQEGLEGVALSTGRWWDGRNWVGPYMGTIERKKFLTGEIGPSTGCTLNAVWWYQQPEPQIAKALNWEGLTPTFRKYEAPPGWYDVNALLKEGKAWFLEWTPRFGWDSEGTALPLLYENLADWFAMIATGKQVGNLGLSKDIAYAIRLTTPPSLMGEHIPHSGKHTEIGEGIWGKPMENLYGKKGFIGYQLMKSKFPKELSIGSAEGFVGLACAKGPKMSELHEQVMQTAKDLKASSPFMYRTDGADAICEDAEMAAEEGFTDLPKGLMS